MALPVSSTNVRAPDSRSIYLWIGGALALVGIAHSLSVASSLRDVFIPGIVAFELPVVLGCLLAWDLRRRPVSHLRSGFVVFLSMLPWTCMHATMAMFDSATSEVTDLSAYSSYRQNGLKPALLEHFPAQIPEGARAVSFFYLPGFLQGATIMQLRFVAPAPFAQEALASAKERTSHIRKRGVAEDDHGQRIHLRAGEPKGLTLPSRFQLFRFNRPIAPEEWNHADMFGIAIDPARGELLYWAEDW